MMISTLYLGVKRDKERSVIISNEDIANGYAFIPCIDCESTGKFSIPNGEIGVVYDPIDNPAPYIENDCVACKGAGKILINV